MVLHFLWENRRVSEGNETTENSPNTQTYSNRWEAKQEETRGSKNCQVQNEAVTSLETLGSWDISKYQVDIACKVFFLPQG